MEDKQLDFNQPLLSVRRFSSTGNSSDAGVKKKIDTSLPKIPPLPVYKSELKSGPIRNPGTVPFMWEQTPGRPKDGSKLQSKAHECPLVAPKLPPGRILNVKQQASDKGSNATKHTWTRTGNVPASSQGVLSSDNNATKCESSKEEMEETASSITEDSDEAYVDALDTLSLTESFFLNCSVSGVSGLDGADLKPSGTFVTDPQTRDFMMGRFLPAAKAMASETLTPQYTTKKQPTPREQPRHRIISVDKLQPIRQYSPNNVHFPAQDKRLEESDDEDAYDGHENLSASICGLLPRFCLKNSFCLMKTVPGMIMQEQKPIVSGRGAQNFRDGAYERRSRPQTADIRHTKHELKRERNQNTGGNKGQKLDGSSLRSRLRGNVESPNENANFQSVLNEPNRFVGVPDKAKIFEVNGSDPSGKGSKNFQELLAWESSEWESGAASPVEKTLYVDSVHKVKSPNSSSFSSDTRGLSDDRGNYFDSPVISREVKGTILIDSSLQDIKHLNLVDEKAMLQPKILESVDSDFLSSPARSAHGMTTDIKSNSAENQDLCKSLINLTSPKVAGNEKIDLESQHHMKLSNQDISRCLVHESVLSTSSKKADAGTIDMKSQLHPAVSSQASSHDNNLQLILPLPPPKSPSDSWLKRTLPTVSKKNSSSWSSLGARDYARHQASKTPSVNPKWEAIVKTSNVMHGHLCFAEELLAPIPEDQKC